MKKRTFVYTLVKKQIITLAISLLFFLIVINMVFDKGYKKYIFDPIFNTIIDNVISYQENWNKMISGFQESYTHELNLMLQEIGLWYENNPLVNDEQISHKMSSSNFFQDSTIDQINWYLISKEGIIKKTNYKNDLELDLQKTVPKYWNTLKDLEQREIRIDKMFYEIKTGIPRIYGYYKLNNGDFFEIGLKLNTNNLNDFIQQSKSLADKTDYMEHLAIYNISFKPFNDFPELTHEDIRTFKKAENEQLYTYKRASKDRYAIYINLYNKDFIPENSLPILRTKFDINFSQLTKLRNSFLTLFNLIISSILIIMLLINYQQVKKLVNNLNMIIKKVHDYEKKPANGLTGLEKHSDFSETEKLGNAFKILSHRITSLIKKQNSANKNLKTAMDRLEVLASHDDLTGVENRRTFFKKIKLLLDKDIYPWAMVFIDMDNLKKINDTFGHSMGDKALYLLGKTLLCCTRTEDLIARIGGDEFVIALIRTDKQKTIKIMERINLMIQEKGKDLHKELTLSISYGIKMITEKNLEDLENTIKLADEKMYASKKRKKDAKNI